MAKLEIWGGIECTVNRVGGTWHDQLELSGHATRAGDLGLIAALGIRTVRYPILWESNMELSSGALRWAWADERMTTLRQLGIRPIVGLLHHGSGPPTTNLLDPDFAEGLASFASAVAARYPWVCDYTPVNEPLTTARFSGLYGLWYPHHRNNVSFCRALINQIRATVLAMRAIRSVNPHARLIQTEDLGTTSSTPHMGYQRDFDNQRRWLTWDLLCGRVGDDHPLNSFLLGNGIAAEELRWFAANPCPPDIIGINHYVTSDRYLDERTAHYSKEPVGSNGKDDYVDVPAVRVLPGAYRGWRVLESAAERYNIPLALTEVHLGCTREEQLRWFHDAWSAALAARRGGCDIRAVTSWALFGSYNWDTLLTQHNGTYESGAFDVRYSDPRPTAIAHLLRRLCSGENEVHPTAQSAGWWQRSSKLTHVSAGANPSKDGGRAARGIDTPLWIIDADGLLGQALRTACVLRHLRAEFTKRTAFDLSDAWALQVELRRLRPWGIVSASERGVSRTAAAAAAGRVDLPFLDFAPSPHFDRRIAPLKHPKALRILIVESDSAATAATPAIRWDRIADAALDLLIDERSGLYRIFQGDEYLATELPARESPVAERATRVS